MRLRRGVSTVADVSLALFLVVAAMGVLATVPETDSRDHEPVEADHTAQTLAASTMNATYNVTDAVEAHYREHLAETNPYQDTELLRTSHGPITTQIADIALTALVIDGSLLSTEATDYERVVESRLERRLVGSQFETHVSAVWTPVPGGKIRGKATLGQHPPPGADVSTTTLTVPSGVPEAHAAALDAVDGQRDYAAVANTVANATVTGQFPPFETQRALEGSGVDHLLTTYRYTRLATILDGDDHTLEDNEWLTPSTANATAANAYLSRRLAATLERRLESLHGKRYSSAREAARAVSTNYVTLTIRTWTDD
jgi:hypothetical protein